MKNVKQIALGLMVGAMAIGFSAFTNASNGNHSKFAKTFYGLNHAGTTYTRAPSNPSDECTTLSTIPNCVISYPSDQGASLSVGSLPSGSTAESGPGWVNP